MGDTASNTTGSGGAGVPADQRRVLATLNADGSRRWLNPRQSDGRFLRRRRVAAWVLIAVYAALPFVNINGAPALMLDVANRKFHVFGATFLATDTLVTAVLAIAIGLAIFLLTALFGRVWCGWACPQTVYMEFVYRPVERLFSDRSGACTGWRKAAKYGVYALISGHLSNVFLAYFVGAGNVYHWTMGSPLSHPWAFLMAVAVAGLMMFDFCFFREQTCLVACPYGRLQSALMDRHSLIVTYDKGRGEPRRPMRSGAIPGAGAGGDVSLKQAALGDCINCVKCVTTCPTGIDIRDGLQMECIGCAQCIDACDDVMTRVGRPKGLIRYSSQAMVEGGASSLWRPRTVIYPVLLLVAVGAFVGLLVTRAPFDLDLLPRQGAPFYELPSGEVANQMRISLANRTDGAAEYALSLHGPEGARIVGEAPVIALKPQESRIVSLVAAVPKEAMGHRGACDVVLRVTGTGSAVREVGFHMLGPASRGRAGGNGGGL